MIYPLDPSGRERRVLAILAANQLWPGDHSQSMTTTEVKDELPGDVHRPRVVKALRALAEAGYAFETARFVSISARLEQDPQGRIIAWQLTPMGLRVALGVLA